jgi:hypothetical protein
VCIGREAVNHDKDAKHSLSEFNRPPANHLLSPGINLGTNVAMVTCGIATHNEREPLGFFVAGVDLQWRLVGACTVGSTPTPGHHTVAAKHRCSVKPGRWSFGKHRQD